MSSLLRFFRKRTKNKRVFPNGNSEEGFYPAECVMGPFKPTFSKRDAPLTAWIAGLPAPFVGHWKLEARKRCGDNPPANYVQVLKESTRLLRDPPQALPVGFLSAWVQKSGFGLVPVSYKETAGRNRQTGEW